MERVRVRSLRPVLGLALALFVTGPAVVSAQAQTPPPSTPTPEPTATPSVTPTPTATPTPTPTPTPKPKTKAIRKVYKDFNQDGVITACDYSVKLLKNTLKTITPRRDADYPDFRQQVNAAIKAHNKGRCDKPKPTPTPTASPTPSGGSGPPPSSGGSPPAPTPAPAPAPAPAAPVPAPSAPGKLPKVPKGPSNGKAVPPPASTAVPPTATPAPVPPAATAPQESQIVVGHGQDKGSLTVPLILAAIVLAGLAAAGSSALLGTRVPRFAGMGQAWREAAYRTSGTWGDFTDWLHLGR
jgi:hypothetical protein